MWKQVSLDNAYSNNSSTAMRGTPASISFRIKYAVCMCKPAKLEKKKVISSHGRWSSKDSFWTDRNLHGSNFSSISSNFICGYPFLLDFSEIKRVGAYFGEGSTTIIHPCYLLDNWVSRRRNRNTTQRTDTWETDWIFRWIFLARLQQTNLNFR